MRRYDILPLTGKDGPELYRLVFTIKACADFEELSGSSIFDVLTDELQPTTVETLLWLALQDQHPAATRGVALKLIKKHRQHAVFKLLNCLARSQGTQKENNGEPLGAETFWDKVAEMTLALGLKPYEAERFTFGELSLLVDARQKENEATMERLAWQTALLLTPHLKEPITADDLLGRNKAEPLTKEELEAQFAEARKRKGIQC